MSTVPNPMLRQIVIVDDDPELLKLMAMMMRRISAESHTFYNGYDALDFLESNLPDLIILDLMLPGLDGFEILHKIRSTPRLDSVPVLILSARTDPNSIRRGLDGGADAYLTKPYIANSLIDRVRLLLTVGRKPQAGTSPEPGTHQEPEL